MKTDLKIIISLVLVFAASLSAFLIYQKIYKENTLYYPETKFTDFGKAKLQIIPLLKLDDTYIPKVKSASPEAQVNERDIPRIIILGKAKITYLPEVNLFSGSIPDSANLEEFRAQKIAIVEFLTNQSIDVCSLNIYWDRPSSVLKDDFSREDLRSNGCTNY